MCYAPAPQTLAFTLAVQCLAASFANKSDAPSQAVRRAQAALWPAIERMLVAVAANTKEASNVHAAPAAQPLVVTSAGAGASYWVSVSFKGSRRARNALINAINDVNASDPCAGWAHKANDVRAEVCANITADPLLATCSIVELHAVATTDANAPPALVGQPPSHAVTPFSWGQPRAAGMVGALSIDLLSFNSPLQWCVFVYAGPRLAMRVPLSAGLLAHARSRPHVRGRTCAGSCTIMYLLVHPCLTLYHASIPRASRIFGDFGKWADQSNKMKKIGAAHWGCARTADRKCGCKLHLHLYLYLQLVLVLLITMLLPTLCRLHVGGQVFGIHR